MKKGVAYEILIQNIFQDILKQDGLKNIEVRRNVVLSGKDYKHEIDVYWKFEIAGLEYETIIQAKDWKYPVNVGELLKFKAILDDLPGQPKGIFITRTGYQIGALRVAQKNGILLYELYAQKMEPIVTTTFGFARVQINPKAKILSSGEHIFELDVASFEPEFKDVNLTIDPTSPFANTDIKRNNIIQKLALKEYSKTNNGFAIFFDKDGEEISNQFKIQKGFVHILRKGKTLYRKIDHKFETPTFMKFFPDNVFIKIFSISANVTLMETKTHKSYMKSPNLNLFILKNLIHGKEQVVGKWNS